MSSLHNIKDATRLLPAWAGPTGLTVLIVTLYFVAYRFYQDQPHELISTATTTAIALSLVFAGVIAFLNIAKAKQGEVAEAINDGFTRGLTFSWATSAVSLVVYVSAGTVQRVVTNDLPMVLIGIAVLALMGVGYWVTKPTPVSGSSDAVGTMVAGTGLALPSNFQASTEQRPSFQVTMVDLTRLIIHQAGRTIAYKGSNCLIDDAFSIELDINERTSRIFSNTNLVNTSSFLYWRMHMLLIGSAAESVLRGSTSDAALDDFHNFDELASRYLTLNADRSFNSRPINEYEAAIKAGRIGTIRKHVWSRCLAACNMNKRPLIELIKLMRARSCLSYGDIRHLLDKVEMPEDFPVAEFDSEDMMITALISFEDEPEVTLEGVSQRHADPVKDNGANEPSVDQQPSQMRA